MAANVDVMLPLEIVALLVQLTHQNVLNKYIYLLIRKNFDDVS